MIHLATRLSGSSLVDSYGIYGLAVPSALQMLDSVVIFVLIIGSWPFNCLFLVFAIVVSIFCVFCN